MKMFYCTLALMALTVAPTFAQTQPTSLATGFNHPESAIVHDKFIYVTDIGRAIAPTDKDQDGAIHKIDLKGNVVEAVFNKAPLNAPKGTAIVNHILYVADIDRVVGFDINSGKPVKEIDLSEHHTSFLNDMTAKGDSILFVSATDLGKIFSVSLSSGKSKALDLPAITGPNGLKYDASTNALYVAGLDRTNAPVGEVGKITWKNGRCTYETLTDLHGAFDGLDMTDAHTLLVSDWISIQVLNARIIKIDLRTHKYTVLLEGTDAADITYDPSRKRLIMPGLKGGSVYEYGVK